MKASFAWSLICSAFETSEFSAAMDGIIEQRTSSLRTVRFLRSTEIEMHLQLHPNTVLEVRKENIIFNSNNNNKLLKSFTGFGQNNSFGS